MSARCVALATCASAWALSIAACCFPSDSKTNTKVDTVGDGPPVEVPAQDAGPPPQVVHAPPGKEPAAKGGGAPAPKQTAEQVLGAWEAKAADEVPDVRVRDGAPPAAKQSAAAYVAWKRAEWVYGQVKLPDAPQYRDLDPDSLHVGDVGRLPGGFVTVRVDSDAVVLRTARGTLFAFSGIETSKMVTDRGYQYSSVVECYRTGKFGIYTLPVIRPKAARSPVNAFDAEVDELARQRARKADQDRLVAQANLVAARNDAINKAMAAASAEAASQIPVPKDGPGADRIRAKVAFERLEKKMQEEARQRVTEEYADPAPRK